MEKTKLDRVIQPKNQNQIPLNADVEFEGQNPKELTLSLIGRAGLLSGNIGYSMDFRSGAETLSVSYKAVGWSDRDTKRVVFDLTAGSMKLFGRDHATAGERVIELTDKYDEIKRVKEDGEEFIRGVQDRIVYNEPRGDAALRIAKAGASLIQHPKKLLDEAITKALTMLSPVPAEKLEHLK